MEGLDQGFAFGLMNLAWAGGQVVGGAAGGGLADATSDTLPYAILALLCAVSLAIVRARGGRLGAEERQPQLGHGAVPRAR